MSTEFPGDEVAAVLAAALVGLDDDVAPLTVTVHLPNGRREEVVRAWYEPTTNELILDLHGVRPGALPRLPWLEDELRRYDPRNPNWVESMTRRTQRRANPLHDVTRADVNGDSSEDA